MRKCIGCGYCCQKAACILGAVSFVEHATESGRVLSHCPGLVKLYGRYWCSLMLNATGEEREWVGDGVLAVGAGCCSPLNTQRSELLARRLEGR